MVDVEVGAAQVKWEAERLNGLLPSDRRIELSGYGGGPWEWLPENEVEAFRLKLARELGVRYLERVPRRTIASERALGRLIAKRVAMAEDGETPAESPSRGVESWLKLPVPSETYDLDELRDLTAGRYDVELMKPFHARRNELLYAMLEAMRECTGRDEFVYAVGGPAEAHRRGDGLPAQPHRRSALARSPVPLRAGADADRDIGLPAGAGRLRRLREFVTDHGYWTTLWITAGPSIFTVVFFARSALTSPECGVTAGYWLS